MFQCTQQAEAESKQRISGSRDRRRTKGKNCSTSPAAVLAMRDLLANALLQVHAPKGTEYCKTSAWQQRSNKIQPRAERNCNLISSLSLSLSSRHPLLLFGRRPLLTQGSPLFEGLSGVFLPPFQGKKGGKKENSATSCGKRQEDYPWRPASSSSSSWP